MPNTSVKVNRCFGGKYRLHLQGRRISREKTNESICYWETSADFRRSRRRYIPEDRALDIRLSGQDIHRSLRKPKLNYRVQ
jgi:hypothetical protein